MIGKKKLDDNGDVIIMADTFSPVILLLLVVIKYYFSSRACGEMSFPSSTSSISSASSVASSCTNPGGKVMIDSRCASAACSTQDAVKKI